MLTDEQMKQLMDGFYPSIWAVEQVPDRLAAFKLGVESVFCYVRDKVQWPEEKSGDAAS